MSCTFAQYDGAYVLGALSPSDRRDYEQHLRDCSACTADVTRLAGLPGLLARVPADVLEETDEDDGPAEPPPPDLLPRLLGAAQRHRRRRRAALAGVAAAAVLGILGGGIAIGYTAQDDPSPPVATQSRQLAEAQPMERVGDIPMSASLSLTSVPWGTRLDLSCSYSRPSGYGAPREWQLALVVHTRGGRDEQVATWRARPGNMELTASTALEADRITSVEVRSAAGDPVMRLIG